MYVRYLCLLRIHSMYVRYVYITICMYGIYVRYVCTVCTSGMYEHMYGPYARYVGTVGMYGMYVRYIWWYVR